METQNTQEMEALRQKLLNEVWAGAAAGLPAMLLDAEAIRRADADELETIARQYGWTK